MKKTRDIANIYNLYVDDMFTYAVYLGFDKEIVMDAIHDVFCKLAADEKFLKDVSNIKFYLLKSMKNRLFDIYKSRKQHIGLPSSDLFDSIPFNISATVEDVLINSEDQKLIKCKIEEMLSYLTNRQREIIYLRYIQDCDYEQISQLLNISIHGCRKLVSKAIHVLREKYGLALIFSLIFDIQMLIL